jgi:hypothetical protein
VCLRRVLEDLQAVPVGHGLQAGHVRRVAVQVHRHDADRPVGDGRLDGGGVQAERRRIDVGKHRGGAGQRDRIGGGREREGRHDHLVAGLDPGGEQPEVQAGGAGVHGHAGATEPEVLGELSFEGRDLGTLREHAAAHHPLDGGDLLVADQRLGRGDEAVHAAVSLLTWRSCHILQGVTDPRGFPGPGVRLITVGERPRRGLRPVEGQPVASSSATSTPSRSV